MRLVGYQAEHDEIRVESIQTMTSVRVVTRLHSNVPDVLHNLVFTLARNVRPRKNNFDIAPVGVISDFLVDIVFEALR
jgi:hypothetical protein